MQIALRRRRPLNWGSASARVAAHGMVHASFHCRTTNRDSAWKEDCAPALPAAQRQTPNPPASCQHQSKSSVSTEPTVENGNLRPFSRGLPNNKGAGCRLFGLSLLFHIKIERILRRQLDHGEAIHAGPTRMHTSQPVVSIRPVRDQVAA